MKSKFIVHAAALAVFLSVFAGTATAERYIVLAKKTLPADLQASVEGAGGEVIARFEELGIAIVRSEREGFADQVGADNRIRSVGPEPAFSLPETVSEVAPESGPTAADAFFNGGLLWGIERVHAPEAWAAGVTGSHATTVAVIDTGIAWNHPDLAANVTHVACYTSAGAHVGPWAAGAPCNPYPTASDHGTHVAGTVAASFDGGAVVGVGPELALAGYNTFEQIPGCGLCSFTSSRWQAMLDAAERGYEVINMSLGSLGNYGGQGSNDLATFVAADNRVANAVTKAGTTIVASAGNSGIDLNGTAINIPGGLPGIVNIGATGIQPAPRYQPGVSFDVLAFYSNFGASVGVSAPGGDCGQIGVCNADRPANWFEHLILSSTVAPGTVCAQTASCPVGYGWKAGTSMASPHAAGVAGLLRDQDPSMTASQAATALKRTADPVQGERQSFGHGVVDARGAID